MCFVYVTLCRYALSFGSVAGGAILGFRSVKNAGGRSGYYPFAHLVSGCGNNIRFGIVAYRTDSPFLTVAFTSCGGDGIPRAEGVALFIGISILISVSAVFAGILCISLFGTGRFNYLGDVIVTESGNFNEGRIIASGAGVVCVPSCSGAVFVIRFVMNEIVSDCGDRVGFGQPAESAGTLFASVGFTLRGIYGFPIIPDMRSRCGYGLCFKRTAAFADALLFAVKHTGRRTIKAPLSVGMSLFIGIVILITVTAISTSIFGVSLFGAGGLDYP